jgi:hypothetical protein
MRNIELRCATLRIGDTDYYRVEQALNELFYTVKIVKFC